MSRLLDLRRLTIGAAVLSALFLPLYFLVLREEANERSVSPAVMRETPPGQAASRVGLAPGDLAPDFEISTTDGDRLRLSDLRGRPVVLNFFALWCTSCLTEMPEIKAAQEERGLETFAVLAVNAGETRERALEFVDFLDAPFIYGLDTTLVVSDAYRVYGLPATVFIDAEGVIRANYAGYTGRERLDAFLDAAIDARPAGDVPLVLRLISTIPRDRVLVVESRRDGELRLRSRSLRCDAGYCAAAVVVSIEALAGVKRVKADLGHADPSLTISFDATRIGEQALVQAAITALENIEDPVYQSALQVTYLDPAR